MIRVTKPLNLFLLLVCVGGLWSLPSTEAQTKRRATSAKKVAPKKKPVRKAASRKATPRKAAPAKAAKFQTSARPTNDYQAQARQRAIVWVQQAADAYAKGDYNRAIELCKNANDAYPTYARAYTWMGASYQKLGRIDEACSAFRWVTALAPGTPDAERAERGLREMGYYNRF
jgi:tetratricopeptide (TPR) repeat protein